jgi:hypothetical protein
MEVVWGVVAVVVMAVRRLLPATCVITSVALTLSLPASTEAMVIFDPGAPVWSSPGSTLNTLRDLHADTVRLRVAYADDPRLGKLDVVVKGAKARGLDVILTPVGPAPTVAAYARFVGLLGHRYRNVRHWAIYNEPDLPSYFPLPGHGGYNPNAPAADPGVLTTNSITSPVGPLPPLPPSAPQLPRGMATSVGAEYRGVFLSAQAALVASGHRRREALIGETSPVVTPAFVRSVLRGRPIVCGGWAHHPYITGPYAGAKTSYFGPGDLPRLAHLLARAAGRRLSIYITEFGVFDSQGPPAMRAAERVMRQLPYVRSFAQYTLVDDSFGTGLMRFDGSPKPTLRTFARLASHLQRRR